MKASHEKKQTTTKGKAPVGSPAEHDPSTHARATTMPSESTVASDRSEMNQGIAMVWTAVSALRAVEDATEDDVSRTRPSRPWTNLFLSKLRSARTDLTSVRLTPHAEVKS